MHRLRPHLALLALVLPVHAQAPSPAPPSISRPTPNRSLIFLDPAHGGDDPGAHLSAHTRDQLLEKDITAALANRVRFQLSSLGINVLLSREPDQPGSIPPPATPPVPAQQATLNPSTDQRAGLANHVHPFACIVFHATDTGSGVHILTSAISLPSSAEGSPEPSVPGLDTPTSPAALLPWDSAQAASLAQSQRLAAELATALTRSGLPVHTGRASIRPLDNLTCPAVLLELAPLPSTSVADPGYQARVSQAVSTALLFWREHAEPDRPAPSPGSDPAANGEPAQP